MAKQNLSREEKEQKYNGLITQFKSDINQIYNQWKTKNKSMASENPWLTAFLDNILFQWVENKLDSYCTQDIPTFDYLKTEHVELMTPEEKGSYVNKKERVKGELIEFEKNCLNLRRFCNEAVLKYCLESFSLQKHACPQNLSLQFVFKPNESFAAKYIVAQSAIQINMNAYKLSDIFRLLLKIVRQEVIQHEKAKDLFFITFSDAGTLNHELEHVRRSESCENQIEDHHSPGIGAFGKKVHYEACAASYARLAHRQGLFEIWSLQINELMKKYHLDEKMLVDFIKKLETLEKDCSSELMQYFFNEFNEL